MPLTQELHVIRAHHLHYLSLLKHYQKHITFIKKTHNPAMQAINKTERKASQHLLNRECDNLMPNLGVEHAGMTIEKCYGPRKLYIALNVLNLFLILDYRCSVVLTSLAVDSCDK